MTADILTAPLAPESYADEHTPIGDALWIDTEIAATFAPLYAELRYCRTCEATGDERCREGGRFVARHEGRAS